MVEEFFLPLVIGCVLRTAGIRIVADQPVLNPGAAVLVNQRNVLLNGRYVNVIQCSLKKELTGNIQLYQMQYILYERVKSD